MRVGDGVDRATCVGSGERADRLVPWVVLGKVRGKVSHQRVERLGPEELDSVLPLLSADKGGIGDNLERGRFERLVQLAKALFLTVLEKAVEIISGGGLVGNLVDIMVESLRILDSRGNGIVLIVQLGEEVIPLQAKLPVRPAPTKVVGFVHLGRLGARERPISKRNGRECGVSEAGIVRPIVRNCCAVVSGFRGVPEQESKSREPVCCVRVLWVLGLGRLSEALEAI